MELGRKNHLTVVALGLGIESGALWNDKLHMNCENRGVHRQLPR
jgi:hypothetical protein